jgi:hypothetical protein
LQNFRFIGAQDRSFGHRKEDITTHLECPKVTPEEPMLLIPGADGAHCEALGEPKAPRKISETFFV